MGNDPIFNRGAGQAALASTEANIAQYDVAIVGYGPTGMVLAALLGQCGHRVIVLERYAGLYNLPRAACFDDESCGPSRHWGSRRRSAAAP